MTRLNKLMSTSAKIPSRISIATLLSALTLTACSTMEPNLPAAPAVKIPWKNRETALRNVQSWQLNGKIAIITTRDSGSATVDWSQNHGNYAISLMGPMGTNALKLSGHPGQVTLQTSDGKTYTAHNPEQLLAQKWGWNLPVSNLNYWIRGLPVPGQPSNTHFDDFGHLTELSQQGWVVQYLNYSKTGNVDLPGKIFINSAALKVKIVVYSWKV